MSAFLLGGIVPPTIKTIDLPAGAQHFWGLVKRTGYSGNCCRVQRSSDSTEIDIAFDPNGTVDTAAILTFVGAGTGYVSKLYDQAASGAVDQVQATQALMPLIVQAGVLVTNASGIPAMRGCVGGRNLAAVGALPGTQEYSITVLAQNNVSQITPTTNLYSPLIGFANQTSPTNNKRLSLQFGVFNSITARNAATFLTSTGASNEIAGTASQIAINTTCIITANYQDTDLAGGSLQGGTLYYNRGPATTVNVAAQFPTGITGALDVRLFAQYIAGWNTNSSNGADAQLTLAYVGSPMTDKSRNALEGAIYDKFAAILLAATAGVPKLDAHSEAFSFNDYASDTVVGKKGNVNLNFVSNAGGSTFALGSGPNSIPGLRETGTANLKNDYVGSTNFGFDQTTFTAFIIFTGNNFTGAGLLPGLFCFANSTLGAANTGTPSWAIGKDHSYFTSSLQDTSGLPGDNASSVYSEMLLGDVNCGQAAWFPYSQFCGGGFLGVSVPAHDNNSDHPQFRTARKFLDVNETGDVGPFPVANSVTVMMLVKIKPHPNYDYGQAYNSANNVLWRNKATAVVKAAIVGGLDGFDKVPGSRVAQAAACHVNTNSAATFSHFGDEGGALGTFDGWLHAAAFYGGKYTTDAEDTALFLNGINVQNLL